MPSDRAEGMAAAGLEFSGEYGFAETESWWKINHMVAPKEKAIKCVGCHAKDGRGRLDWQALGYKGDPSIARSAERDVYALYARTDRWKYVLYTQAIGPQNRRYIWIVHKFSKMPVRRQGQQNLFDLDADPYEMTDLAGKPEHAKRLADFKKQALDWWQATGGKPLAAFR